ncbi:MAG: carboxymuconolactone decarboxylase family protein [Kiloniellales bacterium]|nr:carboxymuconolactone decarboxylase family protein [Kiloniellales bacterium]
MDQERFDKGLAVRKAVLGEAYVSKSLDSADDFNRGFQEILTEYCWGACWGDDTLDLKQRSLLNLGMIAALNRMHEFELHFRGAINNGVTREELRAILTQITAYCGFPCGVECFRIARKVFAELDGEAA